MKEQYTDKTYWEEYWDKENREIADFYFNALVDRYVQWEHVRSYMEIGGAPGSIMSYIAKKYRIPVATVDYSDQERIRHCLEKNGVSDYRVIQEDFSEFDIQKHRDKYDMVASWGFVEHFERNVTAAFIEKQKKMVTDGGYLIVELPNIRKLVWLAYWLFNRKMIAIHNLQIMDLEWLKQCVLDGGEFELLYASYYFTMNTQNEFFTRHKLAKGMCRQLSKHFEHCRYGDKTKGMFFPYIVLIARKTE